MARDPRKTVVLDTNIFIYAQDYAQQGHQNGEDAAEVLKAIGELGYTPVIAAATLDDLARSGRVRESRVREAKRYARVDPGPPGDLRQRAGYGDSLSANDECDLRILAALDQELAAWIITNDKRMINHAEQAGLTHVLEARQFLEFLGPARHPLGPPPRVGVASPSRVDVRSPFFASLIDSYPEFHEWWEEKVVPQNRTTLVVGEPEDPRALAVLKEDDTDYGLPSGTTKICTFKVSHGARGQRYGELLLKAAIRHIRTIPSSTVFLEVAAGNELVAWLEPFGFEARPGVLAANGDVVMVKSLTPGGQRRGLDPWTYHVTYGPGALRRAGVPRAHQARLAWALVPGVEFSPVLAARRVDGALWERHQEGLHLPHPQPEASQGRRARLRRVPVRPDGLQHRRGRGRPRFGRSHRGPPVRREPHRLHAPRGP